MMKRCRDDADEMEVERKDRANIVSESRCCMKGILARISSYELVHGCSNWRSVWDS